MEKQEHAFEKELKNSIGKLRKVLSKVQTLKKVGVKNSNIVNSQDLYAKTLAEKNRVKFEELEKRPPRDLEKKLNLMSDIMFTNFEITNSNIEMLKAYVDEYYDRFLLLEKSLTVILKQLENVTRMGLEKEL